jgi:lysozyme
VSASPGDRLQAMLVRHEGLRLRVYQDPLGIWTIGVGRNLEDKGITEGEALMLLEHDIEECRSDANLRFKWFVALEPARQDCLINMIFNVGMSRFLGFKKLIAALEALDFEAAAKEMEDSRWAAQVKGRAVELAQMMRSGKYA